MKITIVGAGNIGTQFAVHCAEKNHEVIIYTSKVDLINKELAIVNENNINIHRGTISKATNDEKEAFENADMIFVTVPAFAMEDISNKVYPYVKKGVKIGLIPGTGGGECAFLKCINKGAIIFGLQRVPSVARLVEYGKIVCATGYRNELFLASLPSEYATICSNEIEKIFDIKCTTLPNYLNLTLTPSNPILHTTRLKTIFKDYNEGKKYDTVPLFYEDWNNETSELLLNCDEEVQKICSELKMFDLSFVKSLKEHYESKTSEELTRKIKSIQGFKGLTTPSVRENNKFIPDLNSRYFTADFNYGLIILIQISEMLNTDNTNMKLTWEWYKKIMIKKDYFRFKDYGINTYNEFIKFYSL